MNDEVISRGAVIAAALWALVVGLYVIAGAVLVILPSHWIWGAYLAMGGCVTSAAAATAQIRCYICNGVHQLRAGQSQAGGLGDLEVIRPVR